MMQPKILFADDQIPDKNIADDDIKVEMERKYPGAQNEGFRNGFPAMRQALKTLKDAGYTDITVARTARDAMSLAREKEFDLAIVDLRWDGDDNLSRVDSDAYGWIICEEIDKTDKAKNRKSTPQIIYSSRVGEESSIGLQAAAKGKLPLLKTYSEAGAQALLASVKFIENLLERPSNQEQVESAGAKFEIVSMEKLHQREDVWFKLTIVFVAMSITLLLIGALGAIFWNAQVGTLTSIASILSGLISSLLYRQLSKAQNAVKNKSAEINKKINVNNKKAKI